MTATTAVNLLIGLAVLALILVRQMQVRPVRANMRLPLILAIIGVIELTQFLRACLETLPGGVSGSGG